MSEQAGPAIRINGRKYTTVVVDGIQRFPRNEIINRLYDEASFRGYDLNKLWHDFPKSKDAYTREGQDMRELYRLFGYSVCGYAEIFSNDEIKNPQWEIRKQGEEDEKPSKEDLASMWLSYWAGVNNTSVSLDFTRDADCSFDEMTAARRVLKDPDDGDPRYDRYRKRTIR